jgi:fumarate hydratase class I
MMMRFLDEKLRSLGTAACPPYHLAIVIGGTSAEFALKTAKYASAKYLDTSPRRVDAATGHGFRDVELEEQVLELTRQFGIGAQFGGKYFCHDVRVIRLPRHGASLPGRHRRLVLGRPPVLGKITPEGVFIEQLETDPAHFLPDQTHATRREPTEAVDSTGRRRRAIDLNQPMAEILAELTKHPVKTRCPSPGRSSSPATSRTPRSRSASTPASRCRTTCATTRSTTPARPRPPRGCRPARSGPDDRRPDGLLRRPVPGRRRLDGHAGQGQPQQAGDRRLQGARRLLPRLDRRPAARLAQDCIRKVEVLEYPELGMEAIWKIEVEDFPAFIVVDDKGNDFFASTAAARPSRSRPNTCVRRST